jgi:DNA-binding transcriptional ArsR family regulator
VTDKPRLEQTFQALGDPARLAMVGLLRRQPLRSGDIAAALRLSRPVTSRHLGVLRKAGLVAEMGIQDDARARMYQLRPERFASIRSWLAEVEAFWGDQLDAFASHVSRKHGKRSP